MRRRKIGKEGRKEGRKERRKLGKEVSEVGEGRLGSKLRKEV